MKTMEDMFGDLKANKGSIVSSDDCSEMEIAMARSEGRFYVDKDGFGFVRKHRKMTKTYIMGEMISYTESKKTKRGYSFESKSGIVTGHRVVEQVCVKDGRKSVWVDLNVLEDK